MTHQRRDAKRHQSGGLGRGVGLTERESEILALLLRGLQNKEISASLDITVHTVRYHVHNVLRKLHKANRVELLAARLHKSTAQAPLSLLSRQ
jgi:DNA-binding NarL/FixJ family response regulator